MTTPQIHRRVWRSYADGTYGSLVSCQHRLLRLTRHGVIRRTEQRVKRGEGSKPCIDTLDRDPLLYPLPLGVNFPSTNWGNSTFGSPPKRPLYLNRRTMARPGLTLAGKDEKPHILIAPL